MKRYVKANTEVLKPDMIFNALKSYEGDYINKSTGWEGYVTIEEVKHDSGNPDNYAWEITYHGINRSSNDSTEILLEGDRLYILPNIGAVHVCRDISEFTVGLRDEFSGLIKA